MIGPIEPRFPLPPPALLPSPPVPSRPLGLEALHRHIGQPEMPDISWGSGRAILQLSKNQDLSAGMKAILGRAGVLASQFDHFVRTREGEPISIEMLKEIHALSNAFVALQAECVQAEEAGLPEIHTKIRGELSTLTAKVRDVACGLDLLQRVSAVQGAIEQKSEAAAIYLPYDIGNGRSIELYGALLDDLDRLLALHDELSGMVGQLQDPALRLSILTSWQEALHECTSLLNTFHRDLSMPLEDKRLHILTQLQQHLSHYEALRAVQSESIPKRIVSGIYKMVRHPLQTLQTSFDYLEEKGPLPSYSPRILIRRAEAKMPQVLQEVQEALSGAKLMNATTKNVDEMAVASVYRSWLDAFVAMRQQLDSAQPILAQMLQLHKDITQHRERLLEMRDDLRDAGLKTSAFEGLLQELDADSDRAQNLCDLLLFRQQMGVLSRTADEAAEAVIEQEQQLATGGTDLSVDRYAKMLQKVNAVGALYQRSLRDGLPREYRLEMVEALSSEASSLVLTCSEYMDSYRDALEAEVAQALLHLERHQGVRDCASAIVQARQLLGLLHIAQRRLSAYERHIKKTLEPLLAEPNKLSKTLHKGMRNLHGDIAFINERLDAIRSNATFATPNPAVISYIQGLTPEEASSLVAAPIDLATFGWKDLINPNVRTLMFRDASVRRTIEVLEEPEDKPEGWGMKVLRAGLWALTLSDTIHATGRFIDHAREYWTTGVNPLRPYADLLSHAAFARQASGMPADKQALASLEMNLVEGILRGFIPYTPGVAEQHPAVARYLQDRLAISPPTDAPVLASDAESYIQMVAQGGPNARTLTPNELSIHMTHFLGQQVEDHYRTTGQQLSWERPSGVQLQEASPFLEWLTGISESAIEHREPPPVNPLQAISHDLAAAVKLQQQGNLFGENPHLQTVQETVRAVFGTPLPAEWIEDWLFKQEWSDERLSSFSNWMEQSLMAQASYHMAQQKPTEEPKAEPGLMLLPSSTMSEVAITGEQPLQTGVMTSSASTVSGVIPALAKVVRNVWNMASGYIFGGVATPSILTLETVTSIASHDPGARRLHAFLSEQMTAPDDKMLAHIVGHQSSAIVGANVLGAELEGHSPSFTASFQLGIARDMLKSLKANPATREEMQQLCCQAVIGDPLLAAGIRNNPEQLQAIVDRLEIATAIAERFERSYALLALQGQLSSYYEWIASNIDTLQQELHSILSPVTFFLWWELLGLATHVPTNLWTIIPKAFVTYNLNSVEGRAYLKEQLGRYLPEPWVIVAEGYRSRLIEIIDKLQSDESFFFPGGWTDPKAGHGTAWEATRQSNGLLTVRHYNTGGGIDYHTGGTVELQQRFLHFTEIVDVKPEDFTSSAFLWGTIILLVGSGPDIEGGPWDPADIYHGLISALGGKRSNKSYSMAELKEPQYAGICAMESLMTAVGHSTSSEPSARLYRFWSTLKATTAYFDAHRNFLIEAAGGEERRRLLDDALKALSARTQDVAVDGTVTAGELHYVEALLASMRGVLTAADNAALMQVAVTEAPVTFQVQMLPPSVPHPSTLAYVSSALLTKELPRPYPYADLQWREWQPVPGTLAADLTRCLEEVKAANAESSNYFEVQRAIRSVVMNLPLNDESFWSLLDPTAAQQVLSVLSELSQEFLVSFSRASISRMLSELFGEGRSPEDFLTVAKILSLVDFIVHRYPNPMGMSFPSLYQHSLGGIIDPIRRWKEIESYSSKDYHEIEFFRDLRAYTTPESIEQLLEIQRYWKSKHFFNPQEREDFFGFYWFPAGLISSSRMLDSRSEKIGYALEKDQRRKKEKPEECPRRNHDVEMLTNWARENADKIAAIDPSWLKLSHKEQVAMILGNMDKFPPLDSVFATSYVYNYFLTGFLIMQDPRHALLSDRVVAAYVEEVEYGKEYIPGTAEFEKVKELNLRYSFMGRQPRDSRERSRISPAKVTGSMWERPASELIVGRAPNLGAVLDHIYSFRQDKTHWKEEVPDYLGERLRLDPGLIVHIDPLNSRTWPLASARGKVIDVSVEELRKLLNISAAKNLQIAQAIGYFTQNRGRLRDPHSQIFLRLLLNEERLLEEWLRGNPQGGRQLAALLEESFNAAVFFDDYASAIYLAGIGQDVAAIYERTSQRHAELFADVTSPAFPTIRTHSKDLLQNPTLDQEARSLAYRENVLSYRHQKHLSTQDAIDLLQSHFFMRVLPIPEKYKGDTDSKLFSERLLRDRFPEELKRLLEGSEGLAILSAVYRSVNSNHFVASWKSPDGFPYYVSSDDHVMINVLDGRIHDLRGAYVPFDRQYRQFKDLQRVFGERFPDLMAEIGNTVLFEDHHGNSYRLVNVRHVEGLQRLYRGRWYELQNEGFNSLGASADGRPAFSLSPALVEGRLCWYGGSESVDQFNELLIADPESGRVAYRVTLPDDRFLLRYQRVSGPIVPLDENGNETGLRVVDPLLEALAPFNRFEAPEYIIGLARDGMLESVDLPRFGLTFQVVSHEGRREARCEQLHGYALVEGEKQHIPELGDYRHYLVLKRFEEDGSEKTLVLFARQKLEEHEGGTYLTATAPGLNVQHQGRMLPQQYMAYSLQNGQLIPAVNKEADAIEANLYLAMVHLAEKSGFSTVGQTESRYGKAKMLLDDVDRQLLRQREGLSDDSIEVLHWIISLHKMTKDEHPDAVAIGLKAAYLFYRNGLDYAGTMSEELLNLTFHLYSQYLTHLQRVDKSLLLEASEEKVLLINGPMSEQYSHRLKQLTTGIRVEDTEAVATTAVSVDARGVGAQPILQKQLTYDHAKQLFPVTPVKVRTGLLIRQMNAQAMFLDYYAIARGETSIREAIWVIGKGAGLSLSSDVSYDQLRAEMVRALKMHLGHLYDKMAVDNITPEVRIAVNENLRAATILLAVFLEPGRFLDIKAQVTALKEIQSQIEALQTKEFKDHKYLIEQKAKFKQEGWEDFISRITPEALVRLAKNEEIQKKLEELSSREAQVYHEIEVRLSPYNEMLISGRLDVTTPLSDAPVEESARLQQERELAAKRPRSIPENLTFAQSIELRAVPYTTKYTLEKALISGSILSHLVYERPCPPREGLATQPESLFDVSVKDPSIGTVFADASHSFVAYTKTNQGANSEYDIVDWEGIARLPKEIADEASALATVLQEREGALLCLANKEHAELGLRMEARMARHRGSEKAITLNEAIRALYQRDYAYLHNRNPALNKDDIEQLFVLVQDYLLDATYLGQQKRVLGKVEALNNVIGAGKTAPVVGELEVQQKIRDFLDVANAVRQYDFREHPEYLVFEYFTDTLIWKSQIETLNAMSREEGLGALIELAMGQGKSSVIGPLFAWLNADGEHLAAVVMPETLVESMAKDTSARYWSVFSQKVVTIPITRGPITLQRMSRYYQRLMEAKENRQVVMWTPSDIQSLFNQWVELLEKAHDDMKNGVEMNDDVRLIHEEFVKIFALLRESGALTVDEVHKVFDILLSHKFTFGSPEPVHSDIIEATNSLFHVLLSAAMEGKVHWEFLATSHGPTLTDETYHKKIKPAIIDAIIEQSIDSTDPELRTFFEDLTDDQRQLIRDYLLDRPVARGQLNAPYRFLFSLEGDAAKKVRNQLAVLKEVLGTVMAITALRKALVHFGQNDSDTLTIPYHEGRPTIRSLFGSVLERILYTTQYAMTKGLPDHIVKQEVTVLENAYREAIENEGDVSEILSRFQELCGGDTSFDFLHLKDSDYSRITDIVNRTPEVQLDLIRKYRVSAIEVFNREIQSSAHIFPFLARKRRGITAMAGTLPNVATYPWVFQPAKLSDTQVKTWDILRRCSPQNVATLPRASIKDAGDIVDSIYRTAGGGSGCLIDATGKTIGLGNEQVAKEMLKWQPEDIEGVAYYDGDIIKVVFRDDSTSLYDRKMDKNKLVVLWDLPHNVGSDIPVGDMMTAVMLVGKHTTITDLAQAVWRMRGIDKGQTIRFVVPEEDKVVIAAVLKEYLGEEVDANLTLDQFFRYSLLIQTLNEAPNNYRGVQERMKMALMWRVLDIMWDSKVSIDDILTIFEDTRDLFVSEMAKEPWDMWGASLDETPTSEALEALLKSWKEGSAVAAIRAKPELYRSLDIDSLFAEWDSIIYGPTGPLPPTVATKPSYGDTVEQLMQTQQLTQSETQSQTQSQTQQQTSIELGPVSDVRPTHIPPLPNIFDRQDGTPIKFRAELIHVYLGFIYDKSPCLQLNDLLKSCNEPRSQYADVFDDDLLATINLVSMFVVSSRTYDVFSKTQKDCTFVQVIQYPDGSFKVKMLDVDDADDVQRQIEEERKEASEGISGRRRDVRIGLLQIQQRGLSMLTGSQGIDLTTPGYRERLLELVVQAKFAAGEIKLYSKEELAYLRRWFLEIGPGRALELFNIILNPIGKSDTKAAFPTSRLGDLFRELGLEVE